MTTPNESAPAGDYVLVPRSLLDRFPEINPSNYSHDDAFALNAWGVDVVNAAAHVRATGGELRSMHFTADMWNPYEILRLARRSLGGAEPLVIERVDECIRQEPALLNPAIAPAGDALTAIRDALERQHGNSLVAADKDEGQYAAGIADGFRRALHVFDNAASRLPAAGNARIDDAMRQRTTQWLAENGGFWDDAYVTRLLTVALNAAPQDGASGEVDLCEVARELERVHAAHVIADVSAIAGDRTDAYWAGHSIACEEIAHRLNVSQPADQPAPQDGEVDQPAGDDTARLDFMQRARLGLTPTEGGGWDVYAYEDGDSHETLIASRMDLRGAIDEAAQEAARG